MQAKSFNRLLQILYNHMSDNSSLPIRVGLWIAKGELFFHFSTIF